MEQAGGYEYRLDALKKALTDFEQSLKLDLAEFDVVARDVIKNGQIQKFEICVELFWKTLQKFLIDIHGIDTASPKKTVKEFFRVGYSQETTYERFIDMINDRNRLSHIYNETQFNEIYEQITDYLRHMKSAVREIEAA